MTTSNSNIGGEYGKIRAIIDIDNLNSYIKENVSSLRAPVDVKQFKSGQSNPTYLLTDASDARWVLRKKPEGTLLSSTVHQIEREYMILEALHRHNNKASTPPEKKVPIPEPLLLCEDASVIGTPFYIMQFLEGRIFSSPKMPQLALSDRRECWLSTVRALAALSSLTPEGVELVSLSPHTSYFPRQIKALSHLSRAQAEVVDVKTGRPTGKIPMFEEMIAWYSTHLPDESKLGLRLVHGDYKIENLVFHPTENRIIGILDWELCTLGSPLADLANLTQPWSLDPKCFPEEYQTSLLEGFKNTKDQPIELDALESEYCRLIAQPYPIPEMIFARSWMLFRLSVVSQGIAARYAKRQTNSGGEHIYVRGSIQLFPMFGELALNLLRDAGQMVEGKAKL
ncbi:kinase-like protein [Neolentinus lepideus HHB14362 ss-1]|uniref:Kinase-like protein n=1 Tax=Neolentinus lepideus HHB14362 ss-1 TaxID=1314782 RepID=A0A165PI60_9AGAM|nr:kinase-like protein [Neolentinus lepideus HHB14362 ss-1]